MLEFVVILDVLIIVSAGIASVLLTKRQKGYQKETVINSLKITINNEDRMEGESEYEVYF